ncbi:MAG: hypothetical protein IJL26_13265, partial [Clostridia bacterium]|nr:hypothetical protein [Clostridia bacterium]
MKKTIAILLALAVLLTGLAACGKTSETEQTTTDAQETAAQTEENMSAPAPPDGEAPNGDPPGEPPEGGPGGTPPDDGPGGTPPDGAPGGGPGGGGSVTYSGDTEITSAA